MHFFNAETIIIQFAFRRYSSTIYRKNINMNTNTRKDRFCWNI